MFNTRSGHHDFDVRDDLNRTTRNLRRNTESLEKEVFRVPCLCSRRIDTSLGAKAPARAGRGHLVGDNDVTNLRQFITGEDKANIAPDMGQQTLERRNSLTMPRKHGGPSCFCPSVHTFAAERDTDLVHLVGAGRYRHWTMNIEANWTIQKMVTAAECARDVRYFAISSFSLMKYAPYQHESTHLSTFLNIGRSDNMGQYNPNNGNEDCTHGRMKSIKCKSR